LEGFALRTDEKPGALAGDRLDAVIGEMRRAFDWDDSLRHLELAREWESRTSILYKLDGGGGSPSVVLKVGKDWTPEKAREVYDDLRSLEDLFAESDKVDINLPKVRGWSESPACVCFDFIEGEDFSQRLSRRAGYLSAEVERAMAECGAAIGLFHSAGLEAAASVNMDEMKRRLVAMGRKVMIDQDVITPMDLTGLVSRKYGDFAPYNIRLTDDGRVWILDQPSSHAYAPIHRDVAYFLYRVERRLGRYEPDDPAEMKATQAHLEDVFLSAYASTGPSALDSPQDKTLFAIYLSHKNLRTARKRFNQRRFREVPGYLRLAAGWRRRVTSSGSAGSPG
jgi:hypothetical protein